MKTVFISLTLFLSTFCMKAQFVTSPFAGTQILSTAEDGALIKKGEPLVKFYTTSLEARIEIARLEFSKASNNLKQKEQNFKRYETLNSRNSVSEELFESVSLNYFYAGYHHRKAQTILDTMEKLYSLSEIKAPFDCKIIKILAAPDSGSEFGLPIMQIEPLTADTVKEYDLKNVLTLTSPIRGAIVKYIAPEKTSLKKGELLSEIYNPATFYKQIELNEKAQYAVNNLQDKKDKFERAKNLIKRRIISNMNLEYAALEYYRALYYRTFAFSELEYYKKYNITGKITAPFDCVVVANMTIEGGGLNDGTPILTLLPLEKRANSSDESTSPSSLRTIYATLDDGYPLRFLPEQGKVIKKGETLVEYDSTLIENEISRTTAGIEFSGKELIVRESDMKRFTQLIKSNSVSREEFERYSTLYENALNNLDKLKNELDILNSKKNRSIIKAPYDCAIERVFLIQGGGTKYGTPILEISKL